MRYLMKQKLWAFGDDFTIKDEAGHDRFFVDGKAISLRDTLSFQEAGGQRRELAVIRRRLLAWGPTYEIAVDGDVAAVVKQKLFTLFKYKFTVDETATPEPVDLEIEGDFFDHEYSFTRDGRTVAQVSKRWFDFRDTYGVDIADGENDVLILACSVVIDQATEKKKSS
jgi:uncharacterized protein YxjI